MQVEDTVEKGEYTHVHKLTVDPTTTLHYIAQRINAGQKCFFFYGLEKNNFHLNFSFSPYCGGLIIKLLDNKG